MARWTASAKWAEGPALDGQRAMPLALRLSEGLGVVRLQLGDEFFIPDAGLTQQASQRTSFELGVQRYHA